MDSKTPGIFSFINSEAHITPYLLYGRQSTNLRMTIHEQVLILEALSTSDLALKYISVQTCDCQSLWSHYISIIHDCILKSTLLLTSYNIHIVTSSNQYQDPDGSVSQVVGLANNSYKPITNTAWVRTRLCKLQKRVHSTRSRK